MKCPWIQGTADYRNSSGKCIQPGRRRTFHPSRSDNESFPTYRRR